jgi:DNA-binding NtrC family response regulator
LSLERFKLPVEKQQQAQPPPTGQPEEDKWISIPGKFPTLSQAESYLTREAMRRANGNQGVAAMLLGISRPALNRRLARLYRADDD